MALSASHETKDPHPMGIMCPYCGQRGTFGVLVDDVTCEDGYHYVKFGLRRCPNSECREVVFFRARYFPLDEETEILYFPPAIMRPDLEDIPQNIAATFTEAFVCYANGCHRAAALLIRRTLEEVAREKGATGASLKCRLDHLREKIILPKQLLDAADAIRVLGNDAAHVEARNYDDLSKAHIDAALDLCRELLKAVYQYDHLLQRLRALQKGKDANDKNP